MERLLKHAGKELWYHKLDGYQPFIVPFSNKPFIGLIWSNQTKVKENHKRIITDSLVAQNCKYALCGGKDAYYWEMAIDQSLNVYQEKRPDQDLLIATSHYNEPVEQLIGFSLWATDISHDSFEKYLVIQVGPGDIKEQATLAFVNQWHHLEPKEIETAGA